MNFRPHQLWHWTSTAAVAAAASLVFLLCIAIWACQVGWRELKEYSRETWAALRTANVEDEAQESPAGGNS
jgi:hypothetical protein